MLIGGSDRGATRRAAHASRWKRIHNHLEVVTSLAAGEEARCSARLSCSTCWVQSAISSSSALISRAREMFCGSLVWTANSKFLLVFKSARFFFQTPAAATMGLTSGLVWAVLCPDDRGMEGFGLMHM